MSDISTTATVVLNVNGTHVDNKIQKQKELVKDLEKAYAKVLNSGDSKSINKGPLQNNSAGIDIALYQHLKKGKGGYTFTA